jgi:predicted TIM-barrel fold metal-dependent hydrolase
MTHVTAAEARRRLGHPVVDADGHFIELMPLIDDEVLTYLEESGGPELRDRYRERALWSFDPVQFQADRRDPDVVEHWRAMPSWWGNPVADALERATAHLPHLLYDRLDDLGVDLMLAYPSWTLAFLMDSDAALRAPACRAVNRYTARLFSPYADRLRAAALIPMGTPEEAVAEIDHAVQELGHSLVLLAGFAIRPAGASGSRLDVFGIDSAFDYDPVWEACVRNRVAPVFHSSVQYAHPARSVSNYVFNHIAGVAQAHEALCKALFIGGVYRRFPALRFAYLEGGVMWGASLLADLVGHWEKRGAHAIDSLDPSRLDVAAVMGLVRAYGSDDMVANAGRIEQYLSRQPGRPAELDEFAAAHLSRAEDIVVPFAERSFFGCEADDPLVPFAFRLHVAGMPVTLRPVLGTDVSHWDAPVMEEVLPEAYEVLEEGRVDEEEFEAFTFSNAVRLHGALNPSFFDGTACEKEARAVLESAPPG